MPNCCVHCESTMGLRRTHLFDVADPHNVVHRDIYYCRECVANGDAPSVRCTRHRMMLHHIVDSETDAMLELEGEDPNEDLLACPVCVRETVLRMEPEERGRMLDLLERRGAATAAAYHAMGEAMDIDHWFARDPISRAVFGLALYAVAIGIHPWDLVFLLFEASADAGNDSMH